MSIHPSLKRILAAALLLSASGVPAVAAGENIVVYSGRGERLIKPVLDEFTKATGIGVTLHSAGTTELFNKLMNEGDRSPADVFVTVDAGTLERARIAGLLAPVQSEIFDKEIPKGMKAPDNSWIGVSMRMRVIAYNPEKVKPGQVRDFDDLAHPGFKGRLGLRTGSNVYVQSHVAMLIAERGDAAAESLVKGWLANAGDRIYPSDSRAVEAVARGEIDAAIVNHYYVYAHLEKNPADAKTLAFTVPKGAAYNISGGAVLRTSARKESAQKLLEFMASRPGQKVFAEQNREYPVNVNVAPHESVLKRGEFTVSATPLAVMGRNVISAMDLIDRVGYR